MDEETLPVAGDCPGSDENEKNKVTQLRALVEKRDPDAKKVDNLMIRRFLRARDLNIDKAFSMFLKYLKWKRTAIPNGFISEAEIQNELSQRKMFVQGHDKMGRPIGLLLNRSHNPAKRDMDEFKRFVVYICESLCTRMQGSQEKFIIIADFEGWGYANCDLRAYIAALEILQNNYPERLGKALLVHVPSLFMKTWKIIYPLMDKNTKKKFVFVEDGNLKEKLMEDIDESQLPDKYGGKLKLVPVEESPSSS